MSELDRLKVNLHKIAGTLAPGEAMSAEAACESLHDFVAWVGSQRNTTVTQMTLIALELADFIQGRK